VMGLDHPWPNFLNHALATFLAGSVIFVLGILVTTAERKSRLWPFILCAALLAAGFGWLASTVIKWMAIGRCLLGLMLIYAFVSLILFFFRDVPQGRRFDAGVSRLLISVLAIALMGRMLLDGRIYHYGFYQAALAGAVVPAVLIGELPDW